MQSVIAATEVVHFGCIGLWQARRSDEAFQIALGHDLRSVKSCLKTHRRRLHVERWKSYRMQSKTYRTGYRVEGYRCRAIDCITFIASL